MDERSSLASWLETAILGRTDLDVTERRRRIFLALGIAVAIPAILVLDFTGAAERRSVETIIDTLTIAVLIANLVLIRFLRDGTWVYRLDALVIGASLPYYLVVDPGDASRVLWAFIYPLAFVFLLGKREGTVWSCSFVLAGAFVILSGNTSLPPHTQVRFFTTFLVCLILAYTIESLRERFDNESRALIGRLEQALSEVKTLEGLLPMCSNCKKIRDDTGYWNQIEAFLEDHAAARFTHSVCPECVQTLYPEFVEKYMGPSDEPERSVDTKPNDAK